MVGIHPYTGARVVGWCGSGMGGWGKNRGRGMGGWGGQRVRGAEERGIR